MKSRSSRSGAATAAAPPTSDNPHPARQGARHPPRQRDRVRILGHRRLSDRHAFRKPASRPNRAKPGRGPYLTMLAYYGDVVEPSFVSKFLKMEVPRGTAGWVAVEEVMPYIDKLLTGTALYRGREIHRRRHSLRHHLRHVRAESDDAQAGVGGSLCEALPGPSRLCAGDERRFRLMGEIVNLRRARKAKARDEKEKAADANRVVHGTPKALRNLAKARERRNPPAIWTRTRRTNGTGPCRSRAAEPSAPCPWRCAADPPRTTRAWAACRRPVARFSAAITAPSVRPASVFLTTTAVTPSPKSGWATPITALSTTPGQRVDLVLHFLGIDIEAAGDHQILAAPDDRDIAVGRRSSPDRR